MVRTLLLLCCTREGGVGCKPPSDIEYLPLRKERFPSNHARAVSAIPPPACSARSSVQSRQANQTLRTTCVHSHLPDDCAAASLVVSVVHVCVRGGGGGIIVPAASDQ